jgi:hypothetical protein
MYLFLYFLRLLMSLFFCITVALTTARARRSALEAKLKASVEAWESANAAKVYAEKAAKSAETRAKKAKKALADAHQNQAKREQSVVKRLDGMSTSVGSKCFPFVFLPLIDCNFAYMCVFVLFCTCAMQQENLERYGDFGRRIPKTPCWTQLVCWS